MKAGQDGSTPPPAGDPITEILKTSRTIAVVGLSSKGFRPSYGVAQYLQSVGYRIWMQEGVAHPEAAESARRAGLLVVMDTCILKEHVKRFRLAPK